MPSDDCPSSREVRQQIATPFRIICQPPLLVASFDEPQQMLSWSVTRPGMIISRRVAWLEVRNTDLSENVDAVAYVENRMAESDLSDAVALMTSRDIRQHHVARSAIEDAVATCLTTVGLSNGERIGQRIAEPVRLPGTINTLVHIASPLSEAAFLETMSIVAQARTTAVLDSGVRRAGVAVTGTGTDCIVIAAPFGSDGARFAGLHTAIGEAIGEAAYNATSAGIKTWKADFESLLSLASRSDRANTASPTRSDD